MDSGADAVTQWLKEEGINAPLGSVLLVRAVRTALQCHAGPPAAPGMSRFQPHKAQKAFACKQEARRGPRCGHPLLNWAHPVAGLLKPLDSWPAHVCSRSLPCFAADREQMPTCTFASELCNCAFMGTG